MCAPLGDQPCHFAAAAAQDTSQCFQYMQDALCALGRLALHKRKRQSDPLGGS